jgi:hypothetical protein
MLAKPRSCAISSAATVAEASSRSFFSGVLPRHTGPTAWITKRALSLPAPVMAGAAGRHLAQPVTFGLDDLPAFAHNRPGNAAAVNEADVRGIHNGVHVLVGDVAVAQAQPMAGWQRCLEVKWGTVRASRHGVSLCQMFVYL